MRRLAAALAGAALLALGVGARARDAPGDFDFYVLSLSWSPSYCAGADGAADSPQCRGGAGRGFIVHGLWPQYEEGYPQSCYEGRAPWMDAELAAQMADIMPDRGLVFGEWRRHGTCTGLPPEDYFDLTRDAFEQVNIPADFDRLTEDRTMSARQAETAFIEANPGIEANGIAVSCADGMLQEVRICMTRALDFRACGEVDRRGCRHNSLRLPAPD